MSGGMPGGDALRVRLFSFSVNPFGSGPSNSARTRMKLRSFVFCVFSAAALGQVPSPGVPNPVVRPRPVNFDANAASVQTLPENYILSLAVSEKDKPVSEMSFVVATLDFNMNPLDLTFVGTISPQEDGAFLVRYNIGTSVAVGVGNNTQFKNITMSAAARLRPGDSVQIYKSEERTYRLSLTRLADQVKKK